MNENTFLWRNFLNTFYYETIHFPFYPPAAYLLTVTTTDGRELTFRLVKQYGQR